MEAESGIVGSLDRWRASRSAARRRNRLCAVRSDPSRRRRQQSRVHLVLASENSASARSNSPAASRSCASNSRAASGGTSETSHRPGYRRPLREQLSPELLASRGVRSDPTDPQILRRSAWKSIRQSGRQRENLLETRRILGRKQQHFRQRPAFGIKQIRHALRSWRLLDSSDSDIKSATGIQSRLASVCRRPGSGPPNSVA